MRDNGFFMLYCKVVVMITTYRIFMFIALTWNVEDLMPPTERLIFNFNSREEVKKWHLYSDSEYGGKKQLI